MRINLLFLPLLLSAISFNNIQKEITNSFKYKIAKTNVEIYKEKLKIAKSKLYGKITINYQATHLFSDPYLNVTIPPLGTSKIELSKNSYVGSIVYSYPIFSGFFITSLISKSELELIKSKLELENVKRELILNSAKIYSDIYAINANINALKEAKKALFTSYEKAKSFYKEKLINKSELDEIEAKYYEIKANIKELKAKKVALINTLSYLINKKIEHTSSIEVKKETFKPNFQNRPDIKAIRLALNIKDKDILIAKSKLYPKIALHLGIKKEATNIWLSENKSQNVDKSFVGIGIEYSFDLGIKPSIEIAKKAKLNAYMFYNDYLNKVKTDYNSDLVLYKALFVNLKAVNKEIKARKSYYDLIQAKFNEGLVDSVKLNEAISKLAITKAKKEAIKAKIFFLNVKLKLNGGKIERYSKRVFR